MDDLVWSLEDRKQIKREQRYYQKQYAVMKY
jgi:hypothetical protein